MTIDWKKRQNDILQQLKNQNSKINLHSIKKELTKEYILSLFTELPETSYQEVATTSFISDYLLSL